MNNTSILGQIKDYSMLKELTFSIFILVSLGRCNISDSGVLKDNPFIRGKITEIKEGKVSNSILVEEDPEISDPLQPGGTKIWLALSDKTKIFVRNKNRSLKESSTEIFNINNEIEGWVVGPVADSYPLQGVAKQIVVIQDE